MYIFSGILLRETRRKMVSQLNSLMLISQENDIRSENTSNEVVYNVPGIIPLDVYSTPMINE